jgi:hypothetical protein
MFGWKLGFLFSFRGSLADSRLVAGSAIELRYSAMDKEQIKKLRASAAEKKKDGIPLLIEELAAYWDCSTRHIERECSKFDDPNKLKSTKVGGLTRFTWESIDDYMKAHTQHSFFSLSRLTEDDLAALDPAAGFDNE